MIAHWLGTKALFGLARGLWLAIIVVMMFGAWGWLAAREKADDTRNQEIGATVQREGDLRETVKRVEQGNATREAIEREVDLGGGSALYAECVRGNRGGAEVCKRFLPQRPAG